jgi:hypothetical protein
MTIKELLDSKTGPLLYMVFLMQDGNAQYVTCFTERGVADVTVEHMNKHYGGAGKRYEVKEEQVFNVPYTPIKEL